MTVVDYLQNDESKSNIINLIYNNIILYRGINTENKIETYTGMLFNTFVKECVQNNQYISLSNNSIARLNEHYKKLINSLRNVKNVGDTKKHIRHIVEKHRMGLIEILEKNEYSDKGERFIIPCSEYSDNFQAGILRIHQFKLLEPIIDVGCGQNCSLIKLLRKKGYKDVFGIDQYCSPDSAIFSCNWFEYEFMKESFGTVISHMAFSNHYKRSLLINKKTEGLYRNKYFEIIESLQKNGMFIYTPSLSGIEETIDKKNYSIKRFENTIDRELDTIIVKRI